MVNTLFKKKNPLIYMFNTFDTEYAHDKWGLLLYKL